MEKGFPILMLIFGGALLIYAGMVGRGNFDMIPRNYAAKVTNQKAYAREFAKVLALIALAPVICGVVGLLRDNKSAVIALVVSLAVAITLCVLKHWKKR